MSIFNFDALRVKVIRTLISPELVWTNYNSTLLYVAVVWNVTSLSLSRIFSFKRSWEMLTGVIICLYDMWITWSWNTISKEQAKQIFHYILLISHLRSKRCFKQIQKKIFFTYTNCQSFEAETSIAEVQQAQSF